MVRRSPELNRLRDSKRPPIGSEFHVYLAIDGLSHRSVMGVQPHGAFSGGSWRLSRFITMFPGTSDASWTRILHTEPIPGYEFEHYDPEHDLIRHTGLVGYLCHALPNFGKTFNFESPYLGAFDYRSNGYFHTVGAYTDTLSNARESFDNLFLTLEGRAETADTFAAYLLEFDVLGHMQSPALVERLLLELNQRIERFRKNHSHRKFLFTIFSDHGMDFIPVTRERLVKFDEEMRRVGVQPVGQMAGRDPEREVFAVTIMHTRVTYLELHTHPTLVQEVAQRVSQIPAVDVAIARLSPRDKVNRGKEAFGVWEKGKLSLSFTYDSALDRYEISAPAEAKTRFDFTVPAEELWHSDEALFRATRAGRYPDLFYRVRTALSPVSIRFPADVIVSLKGGYASMEKELPGGASDLAMSAFHEALDAPGTVGTLLTEERDLPPAVRSGTLLELFPKLASHLRSRRVKAVTGDPGASLSY